MSQARILVEFAHPVFHRSRVNRRLVKEIEDLEKVEINDLYYLYPDLDIDVTREQERVIASDLIMFQFPMYWYSTPAILKEWQDLVLEHGWAYGASGSALEGKHFAIAVTTGATGKAYCESGESGCSVKELLAPLYAMAAQCGMLSLPPYVVFGTYRLDEDDIDLEGVKFKKALRVLQKMDFNQEKVQKYKSLNQYFDMEQNDGD